ncbi:MAG TPA: hypothetical protein VH025_11235 [Solirubrobacteraceae bacterium]|nr:hypothetical protein [Solirubrobacteraceae bacterium]
MTIILVLLLALVAFLYALIGSMNHGRHFAPQAYYRRKTVGAPIATERDALGPRSRRLPGMAIDADVIVDDR